MIIEIPKYNTREYEIVIKNYSGEISELNFVVEDCEKNTMFKKTLNHGIIKDTNYILKIMPDDTKNMNVLYTYKYFIEIIINSPQYVDTRIVGDFLLTESSSSLGDEI